MDITAEELMSHYDLRPHPEGGYFRETYRAEGVIPQAMLKKHKGDRCFSTAIYFLLPKGDVSRLHRIKSDEVWHFYFGGPLVIVQLFSDGRIQEVTLGQDLKNKECVQHVVPAGCWVGAYLKEEASFAFVGCTVAPGFDFADFELGNRQELKSKFPNLQHVINKLCK